MVITDEISPILSHYLSIIIGEGRRKNANPRGRREEQNRAEQKKRRKKEKVISRKRNAMLRTFFSAVAEPESDKTECVLKNICNRLTRTQHDGTDEACTHRMVKHKLLSNYFLLLPLCAVGDDRDSKDIIDCSSNSNSRSNGKGNSSSAIDLVDI